MSILDRYLIRQVIPPFLLALGVFTFVLAVQPMLEVAKVLLAKGVPLQTVGLLLFLLLPSALSLTIPMAFLTGLLMALGRLSGDRESVALLACGISPVRLLKPVLVLGLLVGGLDMYILMRATPDSNQAYRNITFRLLTEQTAADIKPRVFFTQFPGKVLYIRDIRQDGRWVGVLLADTTEPGRPTVTLAESGGLVIDQAKHMVRLVLEQTTQYVPGRTDTGVYTVSQLNPGSTASIYISPESVFGNGQTVPGMREMTWRDLDREIAQKRAEGLPAHAEIMQQQQMISFPVACLVFALIGLAVGLNTRKEGRLAGLTLGLAVIITYYAVFAFAQAWTRGVAGSRAASVELVAVWARWVPNIVLGAVGLLAFWRQTRPSGLNLPVGLTAWLDRRRSSGESDAAAAVGADATRPGTVVGPPPRTGLPTFRLLDRYVGGQFLWAAALAFLGLLSLYYVGAFLDLADKLFKHQADAWVFTRFLIHSTPQFVVYTIPAAILIAVLGTIGGLTRSSELIVMRACGVSLYRAALPLLVFAVIGSGLLFTIEERVLGESNRMATLLRDQLRDPAPRPAKVALANNQWILGRDGRFYAYAAFGTGNRINASQPTIQGLSVFATTDSPYRLREHLYATQARFENGAWRALDGWTQTFAGEAITRRDFTAMPLAGPSVEDFRRAQIDPSTMSFREYRDYVRRLGASGFNVAEQEVDLYRKVAFPAVTVVMTLLAIPFGVTLGRKGALYGIGLATILAAGYFLLMTFFLAVGAAGLMPPMLAAWGANIIFGAGALYMILTVRT